VLCSIKNSTKMAFDIDDELPDRESGMIKTKYLIFI
jgi:hypothetical protein